MKECDLDYHFQLQLASMVSGYAEPSVYIKHVCFTNFTA